MHSSEGLDEKGLMEHLSAKYEVLTLAGVSPGSGVVHQEVKMELQEAVFERKHFVKKLGPRR